MIRLTIILILCFVNLLHSQFVVVQSNSKNYSYDPVTKIHKLTDGTNRMQATALWNDTSVKGYEKLNLNEDFIIEAEMYFGFKDKEGADGIAFVLQTQGEKALGSLGVGMGFAMNIYDGNKRVFPSFGIEIDTWFNHPGSPPAVDRVNADHISYVTNGDLNDLMGNDEFAKYDYNNNTHKDIEDGKFHCVKYHWDAELSVLSTYFDGQLRKTENLNLGLSKSLESLLGSEQVWWGFTTGTATRDNVHMLIFNKVLRGEEATITNINTQTPTLIGDFCEKIISPCDNIIEFNLDETGLKIIDAKWELVPPIYDNVVLTNNNKTLTDEIYNDKLYVVEVSYEDGTKAVDSVKANFINLTLNMPDTISICNDESLEIKGELFLKNELVEDNSKVLWNWRPKDLFSSIKNNTAYLKSGTMDTTISCDIVYQVSDSVTNCVISKEIAIVSTPIEFVFELFSDPCNAASSLIFKYKNGDRINESIINNVKWKINKKDVDSENIMGFDSILVAESGTLELLVTTNNGCEYSLSEYINIEESIKPKRIIEYIENDYCVSDTVELFTGQKYYTYNWSNGSKKESIKVTKSGKYWVSVLDSSTNCVFYDTVNIEFSPQPTFDFNPELSIALCDEDYYELQLETDEGNKIEWFDLNGNKISTGSPISLKDTTTLFARITNEFGCSVITDTFTINISKHKLPYILYSEENSNVSDFGICNINSINSRNIIVENVTNEEIIIDNLYLERKIIFSIPSSQFPIVLPPLSKDTIIVIMSSKYSGEFQDVLMSNDNCKSQKIILKGLIEYFDLEIVDNCNTSWEISESKNISFSVPYPNPNFGEVRINYIFEKDLIELENIELELLDPQGNDIEYGINNYTFEKNNNILSIRLNNNLNSGVYVFKFRYRNLEKYIPISFIK